eukprot:8735706-Alexandrium_andersonii.AAC.1
MSASLVGSEMCIRDSVWGGGFVLRPGTSCASPGCSGTALASRSNSKPVSYTHLTLPTICSV